jgi:hypothetical protein
VSRFLLATALALSLAACGDVRPGTRLSIQTEVHPVGTCPGSDHLTVWIERDGDAAVFVDASASDRTAIIWPVGFAAWFIDGQTLLYARDGSEVIRAGDTVVEIGGSAGGPGQPFRVCSVGARSYS